MTDVEGPGLTQSCGGRGEDKAKRRSEKVSAARRTKSERSFSIGVSEVVLLFASYGRKDRFSEVGVGP